MMAGQFVFHEEASFNLMASSYLLYSEKTNTRKRKRLKNEALSFKRFLSLTLPLPCRGVFSDYCPMHCIRRTSGVFLFASIPSQKTEYGICMELGQILRSKPGSAEREISPFPSITPRRAAARAVPAPGLRLRSPGRADHLPSTGRLRLK